MADVQAQPSTGPSILKGATIGAVTLAGIGGAAAAFGVDGLENLELSDNVNNLVVRAGDILKGIDETIKPGTELFKQFSDAVGLTNLVEGATRPETTEAMRQFVIDTPKEYAAQLLEAGNQVAAQGVDAVAPLVPEEVSLRVKQGVEISKELAEALGKNAQDLLALANANDAASIAKTAGLAGLAGGVTGAAVAKVSQRTPSFADKVRGSGAAPQDMAVLGAHTDRIRQQQQLAAMARQGGAPFPA